MSSSFFVLGLEISSSVDSSAKKKSGKLKSEMCSKGYVEKKMYVHIN